MPTIHLTGNVTLTLNVGPLIFIPRTNKHREYTFNVRPIGIVANDREWKRLVKGNRIAFLSCFSSLMCSTGSSQRAYLEIL